MDIKLIFRQISQKLLSDFNLSGQISHPTIKGSYREDTLKEFLVNKLPMKYGIGKGEIVSSLSENSIHHDLIIYDKEICPILICSDTVQVFPIEGIYGVIEVSSMLSKEKFELDLTKISQLKQIAPRDSVSKSVPLGTMIYPRPMPFGIIFAYSLSDNSLDSIWKNLEAYRKCHPSSAMPNIIVVLNEGIIYWESEKHEHVLISEDIKSTDFPIALHFKKDTLFEFYSSLSTILTSTHLGDINISKYKDLPKKVGTHFVRRHDRYVRKNKVYALNEKFIDKLVTYCKKTGKKKMKEILLSQFGVIPKGTTEDELNSECYYYDPENLPGMHEISQPPFKPEKNGRMVASCRMKVPSYYIVIDGEVYYFPEVYITDDDLSEVTGKSIDDL